MNKEFENNLRTAFPQIFCDLGKGTLFMVEANDGWYNLIFELCTDIMALNPDPRFKATQVKRKFGLLRFYFSGSSDPKIFDLIRKAEEKSSKVCEFCGSEGTRDGWMVKCSDCSVSIVDTKEKKP